MSKPRRGVFERPLAQALIAALLVFGLLAAFLLFSHRSADAITSTAARNEVRVLATQIEGALRRIEMSIGFLHDKYVRVGLHENTGTPAWQESLRRLQQDMLYLARDFPEVVAIVVADARGRIQASTLDGPPQWEIQDREYFRDALESGSAALAYLSRLRRIFSAKLDTFLARTCTMANGATRRQNSRRTPSRKVPYSS